MEWISWSGGGLQFPRAVGDVARAQQICTGRHAVAYAGASRRRVKERAVLLKQTSMEYIILVLDLLDNDGAHTHQGLLSSME